jgi:hypothetical protein
MEGECDELRSINKCGLWPKEDPPLGTKVIPLKWVYKVKKNPDGIIARYKGSTKCLEKTTSRHTVH